MEERMPRAPLPLRQSAVSSFGVEMTHEQLIDALRALDGLVDVGRDPPNFHFRSQPFLHFHEHDDGTYADVSFGDGDFEPIWASSPQERLELLARVADHVERIQTSKKGNSGRWTRGPDR